MIRVQKGAEPHILQVNKSKWTTDLLNLVSHYQSYAQIPQKEKDSATSYYRHPEIQDALKNENGLAKCVYCESFVDLTSHCSIEHFYPKSVYPKETFVWDNLFPCCSWCNSSKKDFDTYRQPFIHPENDNPEDFLTFEDMMYVPKYKMGVDFQKAENVINECDLQRLSLIRAHADILYSFRKSCISLKKVICDYRGYVQEVKKMECVKNIYSFLNDLKSEASYDSQYAGFMRYLLRKNETIREAVDLINQRKFDIGLSGDFDWGF